MEERFNKTLVPFLEQERLSELFPHTQNCSFQIGLGLFEKPVTAASLMV